MRTSVPPDDDWILPYSKRIRSAEDGRPILELGCGAGRDTVRLERLGRVVALDADERRLLECRSRARRASLVCADLAKGLPFRSGVFAVVVASLCLHYFTWATTLRVVDEIRRVMVRGGLLIVRVNSTRDVNYGAVGYPAVEPMLYMVKGRTKRFFDRDSILALFGEWTIDAMEERPIARYEKLKWIWELSVRPEQGEDASIAPE